MSWSDDTRCLYCDGKLPLYRKLTNGQFCSTPHQKAYWKEQERLAVEVLHRTHDALMAYRPQGDIELIIGPAVGWNGSSPPASVPAPEPVRTDPPRPEPVQPRAERPIASSIETPVSAPIAVPAPAPQIRVSEPAAPPLAHFVTSNPPEGVMPRWTVLPLLRSEDPVPLVTTYLDVPVFPTPGGVEAPATQLRLWTDRVRVPVSAAVIAWAGTNAAPLPVRPSAPAPVASLLEPQSPGVKLAPEVALAQVQPLTDEKQIVPAAIGFASLSHAPGVPDALPFTPLNANPLPGLSDLGPVAAEPVAFTNPSIVVKRVVVEPVLLEQLTVEVADSGPVPPMAGWRHKEACFASASCTAVLVERDAPEAEFPLGSPRTPVLQRAEAEFYPAGLESPKKLCVEIAKSELHPRSSTLTWFRLGAFNPPQMIGLPATSIDPRPRLAGGCRYMMNRASQALFPSAVHALNFGAVSVIAFPALPDQPTALPTHFSPGLAVLENLTAWKSEIPVRAMKRDSARARGSGQALALSTAAWLPALRLQPLKWAVSPPVPEVPVEATAAAPAAAKPGIGVEIPVEAKAHPHLGHLLVGFWKNAPRDLRLLMFAIPALLALAFHPSLPKVHVSTVQATEPVQKNVGQAINGSWTTFKQVVSERAAVSLDEDFRSGLDDWASPGGNATEWSFDANGFVRPGSLALYSPSLPLADYEAQFLGLIDQKSLSWVVRAEDFSNYYVVKLVVRKPGPLTTLGLTRYAVIDGKPQDRVDAVVPFTARPDMLYRVRMDVHDDSFVLAIQGQMVDAWSEPRLKKGGIGFFSARGEVSRVRWLQVTHQYDMLGRLCSYLAPYDQSAVVLPTETTTKNNSTKNNGSWQR